MFDKILASLLCAVGFSAATSSLNADESESRARSGLTSKTFRFDPQKQPRTSRQKELQKWANSTLKEKIGLSQDSSFSVSKKRSIYQHGETYKLQQTHFGLPVEQLESVITLTKDSRPKKVRGRIEAIEFTGNMEPTITMRQALELAGHTPNTSNEGELVFWLDSDSNPTLSYKLIGRFTANNSVVDQIVFLNAHSGRVLVRISNEFSLLKNRARA